LASKIVSNPGDAFIHLQSHELAALLALLYELQDEDEIFAWAQEKNLELTKAQCNRISHLWTQLVPQSKK